MICTYTSIRSTEDLYTKILTLSFVQYRMSKSTMLCRMSDADARSDIRDSVSLGASSPAPSQGAAAATIQARLTHSTVVRNPDPDFICARGY
jgi:hypothetical protein